MDQSFSLQDLYEDRLETQRISTRFLNRYDGGSMWIITSKNRQ